MLPLKCQSINVQHSTCTQYMHGNKLLKIPPLAYIATMYIEQNCISTATMHADKDYIQPSSETTFSCETLDDKWMLVYCAILSTSYTLHQHHQKGGARSLS